MRVNLSLAFQLHANKLITNILRCGLVIISTLVVRKADGERSLLDFLGEDISLVQEKNNSCTLQNFRLAQLSKHYKKQR